MSINNPIIPPGSPLQRSHPAKNSKLVLAVSLILTVHVVILAGLLIQGCQRQDAGLTADAELATNSLRSIPTTTPTSASSVEQHKLQPTSNTATAPTSPVRSEPSTVPTNDIELFTQFPAKPTRSTPPTTSPEAVTTAPNVTASHLPLAVAATPTPTAPRVSNPPTTADLEGAQTLYVVKSGDNLTKIAKAHGTTVKAIRALNDLKTDRIVVGQKIKVPAAGSVPSATETPTPAGSNPR